jgi:glycosyltransferase involved in cell wall biosynthesis
MWMNPGKAPWRASEWASQENVPLVFFGVGPFAPSQSREVSYEKMAEALAQFEYFVYLPTVIEPFGRSVIEAYAAGCEIVTSQLVGARHYVENGLGPIETATDDFWRLVCG